MCSTSTSTVIYNPLLQFKQYLNTSINTKDTHTNIYQCQYVYSINIVTINYMVIN